MVIVTGLVGTGKTVEALKQCARNRWTFVTEYREGVGAIQALAKKLKLQVDVVPCAALASDYSVQPGPLSTDASGAGYYIGNMNSFLKSIFGEGLKGFTCEGEDLIITCKDEKLGFYRKDIHLL